MLALDLDADLMTTSAHLGVEKPSAEFFQSLISMSGFRADEIAYVGDRLDNDVLPAQAAGMIAVFLVRGPWGRIHAKSPDATRATLRLEALSALPEALERFKTAGR